MNPKLKSENYQNFGGINAKFSPYVTGPMEFLDLINFDFQTPGSLSQRWGSTQYTGQTFAGTVRTLTEFERLDGSSYLVVGSTGGLWSGNGQVSLSGVSMAGLASTFIPGVNCFGAVGFYSPFQESLVFVLDSLNIKWGSGQGGGVTTYVDPSLQKDNIISTAVLNNYLFMADGNKFVKFDGSTAYLVSLPYVLRGVAGVNGATVFISSLNGATASLNYGWPTAYGLSQGLFYVYMSYVNNRGLEGPLTPMASIAANAVSATWVAGGGTFINYGVNVATPLQYGISAINQYYYFVNYGASGSPISFHNYATFSPFLFDPIFVNQTPASGSTQTWVITGFDPGNVGLSTITSNLGTLYQENNYLPIGATMVAVTFGFGAYYSEYDITNYYPRYLEVYENRLFLAGFSTTPSLVWFSDVAEPEGYAPDFNFEVRTNDSDYVTAMKSYAQRLFLFKKNSFHVLSGDNPNNFILQQVSTQYGCVNHRSVIVFENQMAFLDRKGICIYNGSQIDVISFKVQKYFDRMNYNSALDTACMTHDKLRNQIMCAIPIDGSTTNNITIVFDYKAGAWTTYKGFNPSVFANIQGVNSTKYPFYGDYSGRVNWASPSLIADNGTGMTCYFKTRFMHEMGDSVQKQFRRLYINADQAGVTLGMPINFYQDYGSSIVKSVTFTLGAFQNRIDFGISAKALAFELYALPASSVLRIHGFTVEERMQRRV